MSAFVRKEIRLQLPVFITGWLCALAIWVLPHGTWRNHDVGVILSGLPTLLYPAMLLMMALTAFGGELNPGTFANLLAQPVSRARIWRIKTAILAVAFVVIFATAIAGYLLRFTPPGTTQTGDPETLWQTTVPIALSFLAIYSGGLWTVLLLRQVAAAFWFTLLVPLTLFVTLIGVTGKQAEDMPTLLIVIFSFYSLAGFLWARRMFLRAQDVQWTGGNIELPQVPSFSGFLARTVTARRWRPRLALIGKEFQLHQSHLVIAGVLALLHLGVIWWRSVKTDLPQHPELELVLDSFWGLWLVMPLLVGCAAIAEERKLGTLDGQLCLPVRPRTQFTIKLSIAFLLSIFLGAVMPLIFEGHRIFPGLWNIVLPDLNSLRFFRGMADHSTLFFFIWELVVMPIHHLPFTILTVGSCVCCFLAFYASSLARNTLQSLGPAVLLILMTATLITWNLREGIYDDRLLAYLIGIPAIALALLFLSFRNYRTPQVSGKLWRRNLLTLACAFALIFTATTAIYHRAWERLTLFESSHGPARLSQSVRLNLAPGSFWTAQLPDGRVWGSYFSYGTPSFYRGLMREDMPVAISGTASFLPGTNWVDIASFAGSGLAGIQSDGSLWMSKPPSPGTPGAELTKPPLERYGTDNDWQRMASAYSRILLLKKDGSVWSQNLNPERDANGRFRGINFNITRLGTDSDWTNIFKLGSRLYLQKADGSFWGYDIQTKRYSDGSPQPRFKTEVKLSPVYGREISQWRRLTYVGQYGQYDIGLRKDGSLYAVRWEMRGEWWSLNNFNFGLGHDTNWTAIASSETGPPGNEIVALKSDGTLWQWRVPVDPYQHSAPTTPERLGTHSDWLNVESAYNGVVALAADGTLWFWPLNSGYFDRYSLLAPSRRPQKLASILEAK